MDKAIRSLRDLRTPYWLSGSRTDVPAETSSHRPCLRFYLGVLRPSPKRSDIVTLPSVLPSVRPSHSCEHSRINILQWILTKLGTYLVLKCLSHRKPCKIQKFVTKLISVRKKIYTFSKYLMPNILKYIIHIS